MGLLSWTRKWFRGGWRIWQFHILPAERWGRTLSRSPFLWLRCKDTPQWVCPRRLSRGRSGPESQSTPRSHLPIGKSRSPPTDRRRTEPPNTPRVIWDKLSSAPKNREPTPASSWVARGPTFWQSVWGRRWSGFQFWFSSLIYWWQSRFGVILRLTVDCWT